MSSGDSERRSTTSRLRPSASAADGGVQGDLDHRPVGDDGDVGAGPHDPRPVQRRIAVSAATDPSRDGALLPVAALGLVEDDRVVAADRLLDHPVRLPGGRADHHAQAGGVREVGLVGLAVVLDRADAAPVGDADDDGHGQRPAGARPELRQLADDLVERGVDEPVELDLADRPVAAHGQSDRGADDAGLGQRRVDRPDRRRSPSAGRRSRGRPRRAGRRPPPATGPSGRPPSPGAARR